MGRCTSFHDDEAQREGCFRGEGLSSPAAVHCRPMVETDLGGGTCGTSYLMAATRSAWTFAVDTPNRLSRSAIISLSAWPSPVSDHISTGSPSGTGVVGSGQVCHDLPQVVSRYFMKSISACSPMTGATSPPPSTS